MKIKKTSNMPTLIIKLLKILPSQFTKPITSHIVIKYVIRLYDLKCVLHTKPVSQSQI